MEGPARSLRMAPASRALWSPSSNRESRFNLSLLPQAVALPSELALLQGLRRLSLEYAQLEFVPAEVQASPQRGAQRAARGAACWLQRGETEPWLWLPSKHPPNSGRPTLQALPHLTFLSLEGNRLSSLAAGTHLTALRCLNLAANHFTELPEGLLACSMLRELSLASNPALCVDVAAAERLAAALPQLQRLVLLGAPDLGSQGAAHVAGIVRLLELLGPRAQLVR